MRRSRSRLGFVLSALFFVINLGGAIYAAVMGEVMHCAIHLVLLVPAVLLVRRFAWSRWEPASVGAPLSSQFPDRLTNLEQSLDAVAIEVERISEGQRAMTSMLVDDDGVLAAKGPVPAKDPGGRDGPT